MKHTLTFSGSSSSKLIERGNKGRKKTIVSQLAIKKILFILFLMMDCLIYKVDNKVET